MCVCGGGGSAGKIFATMLLHFVIPFNLMQHDHVNYFYCFKFNKNILTGWERKVHVTRFVDLYSGQILV